MPTHGHFSRREILTSKVGQTTGFGLQSDFVTNVCVCKITSFCAQWWQFMPPWLTSRQTDTHTHEKLSQQADFHRSGLQHPLEGPTVFSYFLTTIITLRQFIRCCNMAKVTTSAPMPTTLCFSKSSDSRAENKCQPVWRRLLQDLCWSRFCRCLRVPQAHHQGSASVHPSTFYTATYFTD